MAVFYTFSKDKRIKSKNGKFVEEASDRTLTDKDLIKVIEEASTVSKIDWVAVLSAISKGICNALKDGNRIHLQGIGTFTPMVKGEVYQDKSGKDRARNLRVSTIRFLPDKEIKNNMATAEFKHRQLKTDYVGEVNDDLLKATAESLWKVRPYFSAAEFISALNVSRCRGYRLLKKMLNEGMVHLQGSAYVKG